MSGPVENAMKLAELFRNWKEVEEYGAQTVLYSPGDPTDLLYFILSGEIELTFHGETLSTEGAGGIIGEMAMIPSAKQSVTATTLTEVKLARFNHDQLRELVRDNTEFSLHVMASIANRLRAVDKHISKYFEQIR